MTGSMFVPGQGGSSGGGGGGLLLLDECVNTAEEAVVQQTSNAKNALQLMPTPDQIDFSLAVPTLVALEAIVFYNNGPGGLAAVGLYKDDDINPYSGILRGADGAFVQFSNGASTMIAFGIDANNEFAISLHNYNRSYDADPHMDEVVSPLLLVRLPAGDHSFKLRMGSMYTNGNAKARKRRLAAYKVA